MSMNNTLNCVILGSPAKVGGGSKKKDHLQKSVGGVKKIKQK